MPHYLRVFSGEKASLPYFLSSLLKYSAVMPSKAASRDCDDLPADTVATSTGLAISLNRSRYVPFNAYQMGRSS
jgi:hypothetical protein